VKEHFELLGRKAKDVVTGFEGVVTSISFDLYGCVQAVVSPGLNEKQEPGDGRWFDTKRLVPLSAEPVMTVPSFEVVPGGQALPTYPSNPTR
jgi:hypothetical protein